ncbi:FadR/GntR family transcriptional regulator [Rhizobium halophilum]|uniref:FadR/GntR family transcriptional regulator n=1 Tax=Rhizobium halophilum TaxID=2846852 RepID=UPI001EFE373A|nr:FadR/GntR family transcriptional regulator [Rhizobium halophilum]MCF6369449.1 FadR family transcriptional regulator [Rhizobium halophilum]
MFSVVESRRLYHQVADQMRSLIDSGVFTAGSRLPAERELAELLAVSRPTVREALIVLEVEGRVHIRMGSGVYVSSPRPVSVQSPLPEVEAEGPFELLRARAIVECSIAEEAARVVRPDQISALDGLLTRMAESLNDRAAALALDRDFHIAVADILDNGTLNRFVGSIHDLRMTPYFEKLASYFENPETWRAAMEEHRAIRDAIAARDPQAARAAMRAHLDQSQIRLSESFGEEPADSTIPAAWRRAGGE